MRNRAACGNQFLRRQTVPGAYNSFGGTLPLHEKRSRC